MRRVVAARGRHACPEHGDAADRHHARTVGLILDAVDHRRAMPPITLAESLVRHVRAGVGQPALARLRDLGVEETRHQPEPLQLATARAQTGLKMPDCLVLLAAEATGEPLATFDAHLAAVGRARGVTVHDAPEA